MKTPSFFSAERFRQYTHGLRLTLASIQWAYLLIAFCFSVTLWYGLTVRDKVETWVDMRLEYRGMPSDLVVRGGLAEKISVRIRAARGLTRTLTARSYSLSLDLATLTKGTTTFQIDPSMLPFTAAYEIIEISPSRIQVIADNRGTREMPVEITFNGALAQDFYVSSVTVTPKNVTIQGAETLVNTLSRLTVPVFLNADMGKGTHEFQASVALQEGINADPPRVDVLVHVDIRTSPVRVLREVSLELPKGMEAKASPARVSIQAEVPASKAGTNAVLNAITATAVVPPGAETGSILTIPLHIGLPDHATLTSVTPEEVRVTVTKGTVPLPGASESPAAPGRNALP